MDRYREIDGGEKRGVRKTPQTPPSYAHTSNLVISHFLGETGWIPANDTFDTADADTCRRLKKKKVVEDKVFRNGCKTLDINVPGTKTKTNSMSEH